MALPIAHATAGYLIHRLDRRRTRCAGWGRALTYMAIGNLPDADFLVGYALGRPGVFHRGVTHTVVAAVAFGVVAGAVSRWRFRDRWWPATLAFTATYASHLLLDWLTVDVKPPAGGRFLWPFSDEYFIAPVTIFTEIIIDGTSRAAFLASVLAWPTLVVLTREGAIAVVIVGLVNLVAAWRFAAAEAPAGALVADSRDEDLV